MLRAILALALLLASTATAHADCAWVLWERDKWGNEGETLRRLDSFNDESDCRIAAVRMARSAYARESGMRHISGSVELHDLEVWVPREFEWQIIAFDCLPDTIDPRGPRTK